MKYDFDDAQSSTAGLLAIIHQASAAVGTHDFGTNDFFRFESELGQYKRARQKPPNPSDTVFDRAALFRYVDAAIELSPLGDVQLKKAPIGSQGFSATTLGTPIYANVMIARGARQQTVANDEVRNALKAAGWQLDPPAGTSGLPDADVIVQLQKLWEGL